MTTTPQADGANASSHELQRKLSNRHLQLIAIGGAIGTGLFMGSGKTISCWSFYPNHLYDYRDHVLLPNACIGRNFIVKFAL